MPPRAPVFIGNNKCVAFFCSQSFNPTDVTGRNGVARRVANVDSESQYGPLLTGAPMNSAS